MTSRDAPLGSLRYVVIDTELTSLEHRTNRLLSVGAIGMQGASILLGEQFYRMVNPEVEIPTEGVVIHQIRSEDVKGAENISKTLSNFIAPDSLTHLQRSLLKETFRTVVRAQALVLSLIHI